MATVKRIVCLANSRKLSGRCIAGKEPAGDQAGRWIRPVSAREHEEVSEYERWYAGGGDPCILDIMDVPLLEPRGRSYQQENWLLDRTQRWRRIGRLAWRDLARLADPPAPLWINGHSTYNGLNDHIPLALAGDLRSSLRLIRVQQLRLSVFIPGEAFGEARRRVQGRFHYAGAVYKLWVTDPVYEQAYLAKPDGCDEIDDGYLTISLGEPHNGACYKLIAAIIGRDEGIAA